MTVARALRIFLCTVLGLAFVTGIAVQSAGIVLSRKEPETALSLFPPNGLAQEELATAAFRSVAEGLVAAEIGKPMAERLALQAYRKEPLTPEAHGILAMAVKDEGARSEIVRHASTLNRRNPRLQAVVLQEQVAQQDYLGAVATLDRILRVRPSRSAELFPSLLPLFVRDGAVEEFVRILDGTSPWHESFFRFALKEPAALANLLELRKQIPFDNQELDQTLLRNLASVGELDSAYELYRRIGGDDTTGKNQEAFDWESTFAPFDWAFSERSGLRAQPSLSGRELEISVRPGGGGVVARRLIKAPKGPFVLEVEHRIASPQMLRDIDILLRCGGAEGALLLDRELAKQGNGFEIASLPKSCSFIEVMIEARAWSGRSALNAEIEAVRIRI